MDSHPYSRGRNGRADEAERRVYGIVSTLTTRLHRELAVTELAAWGRWTRHHNIQKRVDPKGHAGMIRQEPFRHAELRLQTDRRVHVVLVAAEQILESPSSLLNLSDTDSSRGDHDD
jgi:hypothetical protein